MLDTLAAFSMALVVCLLLLPILVDIQHRRDDLDKERIHYHELYDRLEFYARTGTVKDSSSFTLTVFPEDSSYMEGCIAYKDNRKKDKKICDVVRRKP